MTLLDYKIISEFRIGSHPYDVFIQGVNIIIEFNGTYWHLDKRFYQEDYFDKYRGVSAKEVWERDAKKIN